jgi:NAD(P)-dependent dehydrogenase (short-subunit alcohol dehydrogenase family)
MSPSMVELRVSPLMNPNGPSDVVDVSSPVAGIEMGGGAAFAASKANPKTTAKTVNRKVLLLIILKP